MTVNWVERVKRRLRVMFRKDDVESELAEEVRLHVEMEADELVRQGWGAFAARREAGRRLGGVERAKACVRDERGGRLLDDLGQDVRFPGRLDSCQGPLVYTGGRDGTGAWHWRQRRRIHNRERGVHPRSSVPRARPHPEVVDHQRARPTSAPVGATLGALAGGGAFGLRPGCSSSRHDQCQRRRPGTRTRPGSLCHSDPVPAPRSGAARWPRIRRRGRPARCRPGDHHRIRRLAEPLRRRPGRPWTHAEGQQPGRHHRRGDAAGHAVPGQRRHVDAPRAAAIAHWPLCHALLPSHRASGRWCHARTGACGVREHQPASRPTAAGDRCEPEAVRVAVQRVDGRRSTGGSSACFSSCFRAPCPSCC